MHVTCIQGRHNIYDCPFFYNNLKTTFHIALSNHCKIKFTLLQRTKDKGQITNHRWASVQNKCWNLEFFKTILRPWQAGVLKKDFHTIKNSKNKKSASLFKASVTKGQVTKGTRYRQINTKTTINTTLTHSHAKFHIHTCIYHIYI